MDAIFDMSIREYQIAKITQEMNSAYQNNTIYTYWTSFYDNKLKSCFFIMFMVAILDLYKF